MLRPGDEEQADGGGWTRGWVRLAAAAIPHISHAGCLFCLAPAILLPYFSHNAAACVCLFISRETNPLPRRSSATSNERSNPDSFFFLTSYHSLLAPLFMEGLQASRTTTMKSLYVYSTSIGEGTDFFWKSSPEKWEKEDSLEEEKFEVRLDDH